MLHILDPGGSAAHLEVPAVVGAIQLASPDWTRRNTSFLVEKLPPGYFLDAVSLASTFQQLLRPLERLELVLPDN